MKILLGTTPQGVVCFVSEPWGGRVSDKLLTEKSKFCQCLLPRNIVLADQGFYSSEIIALSGAALHIPAFIKGRYNYQRQRCRKQERLQMCEFMFNKSLVLSCRSTQFCKAPCHLIICRQDLAMTVLYWIVLFEFVARCLT